MIDVFEALGWLNLVDDCSHLNAATRRLTQAARVTSRSDDGVIRMIDRLQTINDASFDDLEQAEIGLHCAALWYWRGQYRRAARNARKAAKCYKTANDPHRLFIALWILGMAQWRISRNQQAYESWDAARRLVLRRVLAFRASPPERKWYTCVKGQMDVDLASRPEDPHIWLNCFEPTALTPESQQYVDLIQKKIRESAYPDVQALSVDLQTINKWGNTLHERAEAWLECGHAAYEVGNLVAAVELLRRSVRDFPPVSGNNHKEMVARWMLGAVEWMVPGMEKNATANWRECITDLEQLRLMADRENQQDRKKWYADRLVVLQEALSNHLPRQAGAEKRCTYRQPSKSLPHEQDPAGRYEYLVTLVSGDRAVADRLVQYERQRRPSGTHAEWVEQSIERLLRSRQ